MNFKGDFTKLGSIDIAPLKAVVAAITEEGWAESSWREKKFATHVNTQTIQLVFDEDFRHSSPTYLPEYENFRPLLEPLIGLINRHFNKSLVAKRLQKKHGKGYLIRMILTRLAPHGIIPPHGDKGYSLLHAHRIHLPVISQGAAQFTVGDTTKQLVEGDVCEINNKRTHSVTNSSDFPRVHLIADWVIPGERCCCGKVLRPHGVCGAEECEATDNAADECNCFPR